MYKGKCLFGPMASAVVIYDVLATLLWACGEGHILGGMYGRPKTLSGSKRKEKRDAVPESSLKVTPSDQDSIPGRFQ